MMLTQEYREHWTAAAKLYFRAALLFFSSYILLMFLAAPLESLFAWIGRDLLQMEGDFTVESTGSGDRTMNYIGLFIQVSITIIGTLIWSVLDTKRPSYNILLYWFCVLLRVFIAFFMISYGMAKVFKIQFPAASLLDLMQPLGEMSPMGLAWSYMGFSEGYNVFTGGLEVLGGLLLIPRRTQTFGAFLVVGVMTHVAMMNFFFDIPVKLFSVHLVLMAGFLFLTDIKRFTRVFITNKPTERFEFYNPSKDRQYHKIIFWFKVITLCIYLSFSSWQGYNAERTFRDKKPKPQLYGIWEAHTFVKNNDTIPPLVTDTLRWRYLIRDRKGFAVVKTMDARIKPYNFVIDTSSNSKAFTLDSTLLRISMFKGSYHQDNNFTLQKTDTTMHLQGILYGDTLNVQLNALDLSKMTLTNRGFHWINEFPYNR
jgi:hypothetical protein